jgi:hypothetical protein
VSHRVRLCLSGKGDSLGLLGKGNLLRRPVRPLSCQYEYQLLSCHSDLVAVIWDGV